MTRLDTLIALGFVALAATPSVRAVDLDRPPIRYSTAPADNPVSQLEARIRKGKTNLEHTEDHGYLRAVLRELQVPESSQVLVFSKTSLQRGRIGPKRPRAIYFNDDVTVGFCRSGDVLELTAADPTLGTVFYTLDQNPAKKAAVSRQTDHCLICHGSSANQGLPGHLARSLTPDASGEPIFSRGSKRVDHSTPFADRWGGWYVTGKSGTQEHMGNQVVGGWPGLREGAGGANVTDLKPFFTVADYPTPHSDLVALMVLEHQNEGLNRLTRAGYQTRLALHEQDELNQAFNEPGRRSDGITRRIHSACEAVVRYFLFCEEAPLTGEVSGTSGFAKEFAARGPFDDRKRSLREFDLKRRLFKYPLSYLIYSRPFEALPAEAKERIYLRLWEVLTGKDESKDFAHLSAADRKAVLEILRDTKKDLPACWKE
jgi:hypothetical protein